MSVTNDRGNIIVVCANKRSAKLLFHRSIEVFGKRTEEFKIDYMHTKLWFDDYFDIRFVSVKQFYDQVQCGNTDASIVGDWMFDKRLDALERGEFELACKEDKKEDTPVKCKFYSYEMEDLLRLCKDFYKMKGCGAGGPLHILLDDDNFTDEDIRFCKKACNGWPDPEVAEAGRIICDKYMKLTMLERHIFDWYWNGHDLMCPGCDCRECALLEGF